MTKKTEKKAESVMVAEGYPGSEPLPVPRQEIFALLIVAGVQQRRAYVEAGYKMTVSVDPNASRLRHQEDVEARIRYLQMLKAEESGVTTNMVLQRMWLEATREGKGTTHGARVQALAHLGEYVGLKVQRHIHGVRNIDDMTEAEILRALGQVDDADEDSDATRH